MYPENARNQHFGVSGVLVRGTQIFRSDTTHHEAGRQNDARIQATTTARPYPFLTIRIVSAYSSLVSSNMSFRLRRLGKKKAEPKESSPTEVVIDLTTSSDEEGSSALSSLVGSTRKRLASTVNSNDDDDNSVIVVDDDDDDEDAKPAAKRVKTEHPSTTTTTTTTTNNDSDEVQVLPPVDLFQATANDTSLAASAAAAPDTDIAVVGTKNHVNLPHMRQHCTEYQFEPSLYKIGRQAVNVKTCTCCYCYVCDIPATECTAWQIHCHATDKGAQAAEWKRRRISARAPTSVVAATHAAPPAVPAFPTYHTLIAHSQAQSDAARAQQAKAALLSRLQGRGPFPPTTTTTTNLTKCQYCGWFSKLTGDVRGLSANKTHVYSRHSKQAQYIHEPVPLLQWCLSCGKVASPTAALGETKKPFVPTEHDISLGVRQMKFELHAHDPRQMKDFMKGWQQNPDWKWDEKSAKTDLFRHRMTEQPALGDLLQLISPLCDIPTDGSLTVRRGTGLSAAECDSLIMPDDQDILLLRKLNDIKKCPAIRYQLEAKWEANKSKGVCKRFSPRLYVTRQILTHRY